jgi:hypothetical protein
LVTTILANNGLVENAANQKSPSTDVLGDFFMPFAVEEIIDTQ